jgi:hypothetical protein
VTEGVTVLGIRHHGPGSARSAVRALKHLQPDMVLIEGPSDAQGVIEYAGDPGMCPPVAIVVYAADKPSGGAFYPYASFSPEWNALQYAFREGVPVRFIDLPHAMWQGESRSAEEAIDPIAVLAEAAGEPDPERWWERLVEQRVDDTEVFHAIAEAMAAVREHVPSQPKLEARREAHMRQMIRRARAEGHLRIAVVCGAWHAPALDSLGPARPDEQLLRGIKRVKVEATWIPWTASRLAYASGYGAGVESPAWYRHLWETDGDLTAWLTSAARLLRQADIDASPAQVVDAVRLSEALSALRGRPRPSLSEASDAVLSVLCSGDSGRLDLIRRKLIVGEEMGTLPEGVPAVPLQRDIDAYARRLRLKVQADDRMLDLDLRQPAHLEQSHFLHRLRVLDVDWGRLQPLPPGRLGTFHEIWRLSWAPELALQVVEAGVHGNTVLEAATARAIERGEQTSELDVLAELIQVVLLSDLGSAVPRLVELLRDRSAESTDALQLLQALPPLASTLRYGDVRRTEAGSLAPVAAAITKRAIAGLAAACAGVDDDAARTLSDAIAHAARAVGALEAPDVSEDWWRAISRISTASDLHGLLGGTATRLLLSAERLSADDATTRLGRALARGTLPAAAAFWLEGFLQGRGLELATSPRLFGLIDQWLLALPAEQFAETLPLLRRTTSTFSSGERRQVAERVRSGTTQLLIGPSADEIDLGRAALVEPVIFKILGR